MGTVPLSRKGSDAVARERQRQVVQRDHLELIQCVVCRKWYVVRVSSADLCRHHQGVFVQTAFPYLEASLRELFISEVCPDCWSLLSPDQIAHPTAYN